MNIRNTEWAKRFKEDALDCFEEAIAYASNHETTYSIEHHDDLQDPIWAIVVNNSDGFWMDGFPKKSEAEKLCNKMGWKVINP